jgi:hypothetical protein
MLKNLTNNKFFLNLCLIRIARIHISGFEAGFGPGVADFALIVRQQTQASNECACVAPILVINERSNVCQYCKFKVWRSFSFDFVS